MIPGIEVSTKPCTKCGITLEYIRGYE